MVGAARVLVCTFTMGPRLIFLSRIVSASITCLDAHAASPGELNRLDKNMCRYLRALSKGRAYDSAATESHGRSWTNAQLIHKWKVLPARAEIAIRRVKWWQAMTKHNHAHLQTMTAFWELLPGEAQTLTAEVFFLSPTANPFVVAFSQDLHLFAVLSGTDDFFEFWEGKQFSVVSSTDFTLMRTAAFSNATLWDTLTERTNTFRSGGSREIHLRMVRRQWKRRVGLHELEKVYGASNTQQERQARHQIPIASLSYHESMCQLRQYIYRPFHSAESRRQLVDPRHLQDRPQSRAMRTSMRPTTA